jgi:hypothetical protein
MAMYNELTPANTVTSASSPLTVATYLRFVIVPFVAAFLIGKDTNTDVEGGWETMQSEGNHGDDENSLMDDDPALDAVFVTNAQRCNAALKSAKTKQGNKKQVA